MFKIEKIIFLEKKVVGILGVGWLGLPLAQAFIADDYIVKGSTTSFNKLEDLKVKGILPYHIKLSESHITGEIQDFLKDISYLIINVPPRLRGKGPKESYVKKMHLLHGEIQKTDIKHILFVSSTAVYGDAVGKVDEETIPKPSSESGMQLLASENIFRQNLALKTTILRFAGLIGPNRHPVTILSNKKNLVDGNAPVNLIHLNDCIFIIRKIISENQWGQILNGVHPEHPTKKEYYTEIAKNRGLKIPDYQIVKFKKYKKITSCKLLLTKYYDFYTTLYS